jgi:DNA processing protein
VRSRILEPGSPDWPAPLAELERRDTLFLRGALPAVRGVAVVGTREPSPEALALATAIAAGLARAGLAVWSGGAYGVDAAAHEAALEAGGPTVAVLGGGLDRPYPREHEPLYARIVEAGGALLARVPDDAPPTPASFLLRNQVLAALTVATVVVEAGVVSGARSTAAAARRLARPLFVVPHAPWDGRGAGCAAELARGGAIAIRDADDVVRALAEPSQLALLALAPAPRRPRARARDARTREPRARARVARPVDVEPERALDDAATSAHLGATERAIFAVLDGAPMHADELSERVGLAFSLVTEALLTLTLAAVVVEGPAGFFRRASRS